MKANSEFVNKNSDFWAYVRLISDRLKYSKNDVVITHDYEKVIEKIESEDLGINITPSIIREALRYIEYRANILNSHKNYLMNSEQARDLFNKYLPIHENNKYTSKLPMNKQRGEKKNIAFLTGLVNIITESSIRKFASKYNLKYGLDIDFDCDPNKLAFVLDSNKQLKGVFSRRFDGAFPGVNNAYLVWEIKEYYYTTTFGSRIADGVYETQLDGYEAMNIEKQTGINVKHVYIIDAYETWWKKGKSYLCRIVDMLHMGLVDEVLFGEEVIKRWPIILNEALEKFRKEKNLS
ncbi:MULTISPECIES: DUF7687 domain-containing protein [Staphylococcus]|uniref:DUF7687 domain-containing protein n=1 Tax=Staphylococcus TaxID=1279 RepID=UPI000AA4D6B3|nr:MULTISPECIES: hypothetical protein [Staphylococcus]MEB6285233.1 hypothetical protein [Staphylococcus haemolyticus]